MSGGLVEKNDVLFQEDKVWILMKSSVLDKYEAELELKEMQNRLSADNPESDGVKYKGPLVKKRTRDELEPIEEAYIPENSTLVEKIDYDSLEWLLLSKKLTSYKDLLDVVNNEWAKGLGFSLKMKRSPKDNADGSKTLRIYWWRHGGSGRGYWKFAITFKFDEGKEFWLLYQEYNKSQFIHNHACNENESEGGIRSFIHNYSKKVKNISKLTELVNDTYGTTLNDNHIKHETDKEENKDDQNNSDEVYKLIELLKRKTKEDDCLEISKNLERKNKVGRIFWWNEEMRNKYLAFRDIVFINKRITKNRFGMPMFLIYVVTSEGYNHLVGFWLMDKEDKDGFKFALEHFRDYMAGKAPKLIIIERHLVLHNSLKEVYPETQILYDPWHLHKSLIKQFGDSGDEFVKKLPDLPLEQNVNIFNEMLDKAMGHNYDQDYIKTLVEKLAAEKELWSLAYHKTHFTGGICVWQRNELLKTHMKCAVIQRNYTVADGFSKLLALNDKEFKYTTEYSSIDGKYNSVFQKIPLISTFAKNYLTQYAYSRLKYEVAKAMKYEIVKQNESDSYESMCKDNFWTIRSKGTASLPPKIYECTRLPLPNSTAIVWSSLDRINTGLPSSPVLALFIRNIVSFNELLFHKRWFKSFESTFKSKLDESLLSQLTVAESALSSYILKYSISSKKKPSSPSSSDTTEEHTKDKNEFRKINMELVSLPLSDIKKTKKELVKEIDMGKWLEIEVEEVKEVKEIKEKKERRPEDVEFEIVKDEDGSDSDVGIEVDEAKKEEKEEKKEVVEEKSKESQKKDEKIKESQKKDDKIKESQKKEDKIKDSQKKEDKIKESQKKEDKIKDSQKKDDKIKESQKKEDKIKDSQKKEDKAVRKSKVIVEKISTEKEESDSEQERKDKIKKEKIKKEKKEHKEEHSQDGSDDTVDEKVETKKISDKGKDEKSKSNAVGKSKIAVSGLKSKAKK